MLFDSLTIRTEAGADNLIDFFDVEYFLRLVAYPMQLISFKQMEIVDKCSRA